MGLVHDRGMNDSRATYVATCYPFIASESLLRRRRLARQAKKRRDPESAVIMQTLVEDVRAAVVAFAPPSHLQLAAWFGTADRLAYRHPSGLSELFSGDIPKAGVPGGIEFVTVVGPRSDWPQAEAHAYSEALDAFRSDRGVVEVLARAAKTLVTAARRREAAWSPDERQYRILVAITAWIYWDDEPGAARALAGRGT